MLSAWPSKTSRWWKSGVSATGPLGRAAAGRMRRRRATSERTRSSSSSTVTPASLLPLATARSGIAALQAHDNRQARRPDESIRVVRDDLEHQRAVPPVVTLGEMRIAGVHGGGHRVAPVADVETHVERRGERLAGVHDRLAGVEVEGVGAEDVVSQTVA